MNQHVFSEGAKKRVLLIDSRPILRTGFNMVLQQFESLFWIDEDAHLFRNSDIVYHQSPDVIVAAVDGLSTPAIFELVRQMKAQYGYAKIIVYTCELDVVVNADIFFKGVDGYLSGNFSQNEFLDCLSNVLLGRTFIIASSICQPSASEDRFPDKRLLSPRQMQIAGYLATGMSSSGIAVMLKKKVSTISTTKATIFRKMKVGSVIELARVIEREYNGKFPPGAAASGFK